MNLELRWHKPLPLLDGHKWRMIYCLDENALTQGFELLNKQGTKTPTHCLNFYGARAGSEIFSKEMYVRTK